MTTRLHQASGLTTTATAVQEVTLDKPILGVKSAYLISGEDDATTTTPSKAEIIDLSVVTVTPTADGEIRLTDATTLEVFFQTRTPEAEDVMVLEVVEQASVPQP